LRKCGGFIRLFLAFCGQLQAYKDIVALEWRKIEGLAFCAKNSSLALCGMEDWIYPVCNGAFWNKRTEGHFNSTPYFL
jgi:hypothetical protein